MRPKPLLLSQIETIQILVHSTNYTVAKKGKYKLSLTFRQLITFYCFRGMNMFAVQHMDQNVEIQFGLLNTGIFGYFTTMTIDEKVYKENK